MALAIVGVIGLLGAIAAVALVFVAADAVEEAVSEAELESREAGDASNPIAAGGDEAKDVAGCSIVDEFTVAFDLTNNSSEQSSYIIDANYLNATGERIGDGPFFINHVRAGERATEDSFGSVPDGAETCEVAEVERFAAGSPDDVSEVTCETKGEDFVGDVATELVATNNSSGLSDYLISFSLMRDGVRVGSGFATIDNVRSGQSAPTEGFSSLDGPADGVLCEVVHVERVQS